ncbi:MAG: hypothetical protein V4662_15870 [Verrucomicrobiota bacterium]
MKKRMTRLALGGLVLAFATSLHAQQQRVVGRTIYHKDKSRTESVNNPETREMIESTYTPEGVLTVKKVFLLNEKSEPLQGNVYDGRGNLVAVVKCNYDEMGRRKEDRLMNLQGETFQIVMHEYGSDGKALQPKVVNLNVANVPSVKPAAIDFTQQSTPPGAPPASNPDARFAPQVVPSTDTGMGVAPVKAPEPEKPKPNFFKRLFQKKEK